MQALPDTLCYLDGHFGPLHEAKVSVLDRGFLFGDGVYEAMPVYGRRIFRFDEHLARLDRSLSKVRLANPLTRDDWLAHLRRLIAAYPSEDQLVYVQVTRGVAPRDLAMPAGPAPTVFIMTNVLRQPTPEQRHHGVACVTARDFLWERGDVRSTSLLGNVLARQLSAERGAAETVLLRDGFLTEGASSNVWVVAEGALLGPHLLERIRVELLRELCEEAGIAFNRRPIPEAELLAADEVLLSSASNEVLPVTQLDGDPVGHGALRGRPGPVYARLFEAYQRAKTLSCT